MLQIFLGIKKKGKDKIEMKTNDATEIQNFKRDIVNTKNQTGKPRRN